jgi:hypothetical protein
MTTEPVVLAVTVPFASTETNVGASLDHIAATLRWLPSENRSTAASVTASPILSAATAGCIDRLRVAPPLFVGLVGLVGPQPISVPATLNANKASGFASRRLAIAAP